MKNPIYIPFGVLESLIFTFGGLFSFVMFYFLTDDFDKILSSILLILFSLFLFIIGIYFFIKGVNKLFKSLNLILFYNDYFLYLNLFLIYKIEKIKYSQIEFLSNSFPPIFQRQYEQLNIKLKSGQVISILKDNYFRFKVIRENLESKIKI